MSRPRAHETGGYMVTNKTVKHFFPGSSIDVVIELDTNHGGYFEFELCQRNSFETIEQDACFKKLKFADGSYKYPLRNDLTDNGLKSMSLILPEDLRECRACILRWNYRAGNNWGTCNDGTHAMGCGPQELYRNCADISVGYNNMFQARKKSSSLKNKLSPRSMSTKKQNDLYMKETNRNIHSDNRIDELNNTEYL